MRRRRHLFRARRTSGWACLTASNPAFGDTEYRPLTIAVPLPRSKQPSWAVAGPLLLLCASLVYAFGQ
jgi:hypothetical protein